MSLRRCQEEIDSAEFTLWLGKNLLSPIGVEGDQARMVKICETILASQGCKDFDLKLFDLADPAIRAEELLVPQDEATVMRNLGLSM